MKEVISIKKLINFIDVVIVLGTGSETIIFGTCLNDKGPTFEPLDIAEVSGVSEITLVSAKFLIFAS